MAITPFQVFFAVRALVRVGGAARDAYEQHVRDQPISLPLPKVGDFEDPREFAVGYLDAHAPDVLEGFKGGGNLPEADDTERWRDLVETAQAIWAGENSTPDQAALRFGAVVSEDAAASITLKQWLDGSEPPGPFARVGLALAEISLEYVGTKPSLFGVGSNGERLIAAVALNLGTLLPDPDIVGHWQTPFAERATAIFFRASLQALQDNVDAVVDEEHLTALATGVITPLNAMMAEAGPGDLPSLLVVRDTIFGPVAKAAATAVAANQRAFFGGDFAADKAIGALTRSVLEAAASDDIRTVFGRDGLVRIYSAMMTVVADRPDLFIKGQGDEIGLARDLLGDLAGVLKDGSPFDAGTADEFAVAALEVLATYLPRKFAQGRPWEAVASSVAVSFVNGLKTGVAAGTENPFRTLLTRKHTIDVTRIILAQIAQTPRMVVGDDVNPEIANIAAGVARMLSAPGADLLSQDQWKDVISAALSQAAKNPATLFAINAGASPESHLAVKLVGDLLEAAAGHMADSGGRRLGVLLFGETLAGALTTTLESATSNIALARTDEWRAETVKLARLLDQLAGDPASGIGAREWLWLYRHYIGFVIETGKLPEMGRDKVLALLRDRGEEGVA
jgi:hypothetical protein